MKQLILVVFFTLTTEVAHANSLHLYNDAAYLVEVKAADGSDFTLPVAQGYDHSEDGCFRISTRVYLAGFNWSDWDVCGDIEDEIVDINVVYHGILSNAYLDVIRKSTIPESTLDDPVKVPKPD